MLAAVKHWLLPILNSPRLGRLRLGPETQLCIRFANTMRVASLDGTLRAVWLHIPNEGKRTRAAGAILRAMGMVPGTPDYVFIGESEALCLEFKAEKGVLTDCQKLWRRWANEFDLPVYVVKSEPEALALLREHGLLADAK